ncbi:CRISPR-associated helicase Cas3' [Methylocystis sp. S23]
MTLDAQTLVRDAMDPLRFWGKAKPNYIGPPFHPLVFHALDVSAVFEALLALDRFSTQRIAATFRAPERNIVPALAALAALHDIGKADRRFQAKSEIAWPPALGKWASMPAYDHAAGSARLLLGELNDLVAPLFDAAQEPLEKEALIWPVAFHHGKPCDRTGSSGLLIDAADAAHARLVAEAILGAFGAPIAPLPFIDESAAKYLSWLLSGLVSLADWIGSSTEHFPYRDPLNFSSPAAYLDDARERAFAAVRRLRLGPTPLAAQARFDALFGGGWAPSAAQAHCAERPLEGGPMLVFIEDLTGSGKTESALLLALRMMQAGKGQGLFVALPTMATANAMYARMAQCYRRMFAEGERPSLALAHGRARLHEGFRASILPLQSEEGVAGEIETVNEGCAAFFADDRRKALLADIGVGTIDQALLAVLPTKYATLRQYGLSGKILVIDEAHAYDSYVSREVERLLSFHAGLGGSAIILSATLPKRMKEAYARAFRGGAFRDRVPLSADAYPLITSIPLRGDAVETPLEARADLRRSVKVTRFDDCAAALARIVEAAAQGGAVAYIRNSVDDAIEACEALCEKGLEPLLFHARFAMCDRLRIEEAALEIFGKRSTPAQRAGRVLVATQVIEQSLDLDLDLIVSDLAPIDLLIQRAGRLWRHMRDARPIDGPQFHVVSPAPAQDVGADWFSRAFPRAAYVYKAHALLWLTAKTLFEAGAILSPDGVRGMIETVYGKGAEETIPASLRPNFDAAEGRAYGEKGQADLNLLDFKSGYAADHRGWSDDVNTPTRLGEAQTTFRLALWRNGALRPYAIDAEEARAWALSEVSIRAARASGRGACAAEMERAAAALEEIWRSHGDKAVILPFADESMRAVVVGEKGAEKEILYKAGIGLKI